MRLIEEDVFTNRSMPHYFPLTPQHPVLRERGKKPPQTLNTMRSPKKVPISMGEKKNDRKIEEKNSQAVQPHTQHKLPKGEIERERV